MRKVILTIAIAFLVLMSILDIAIEKPKNSLNIRLDVKPLRKLAPDENPAANFNCGQASLIAVICFYGSNEANIEDLNERLAEEYNEPIFRRKGGIAISPKQIVYLANSLGYQANYWNNASFLDILRALYDGYPPIVMANSDCNVSRYPAIPSFHYFVVVGVSETEIYLADSEDGGIHAYPLGQFLASWATTRNTMVVIYK